MCDVCFFGIGYGLLGSCLPMSCMGGPAFSGCPFFSWALFIIMGFGHMVFLSLLAPISTVVFSLYPIVWAMVVVAMRNRRKIVMGILIFSTDEELSIFIQKIFNISEECFVESAWKLSQNSFRRAFLRLLSGKISLTLRLKNPF